MNYSSIINVNNFTLSLLLFFCSLSVSAQDQQMVFVQGNPVGAIGKAVQVDIGYNTSNQDSTTTGLGLRIHFNSQHLHLLETIYVLDKDLVVDVTGPFYDTDDYDNNAETDRYYSVGWASLFGDWPNQELPSNILSLQFDVDSELNSESTNHTNINFSSTAIAAGYDFLGQSYSLELLSITFDFDENGHADALTDGLLFLRYAFGLRGSNLVEGVMDPSSTMTPSEVESKINSAQSILDIDLDGEIGALTDGLLLLRYLFDLSGQALIDGVVSPNALRTSIIEITTHLEKFIPANTNATQPEQIDTIGPVITLIDKGPETVIETDSDEILYIPNENISYQTSGSIFYTNENDELIEVKGEIIGYRQQHPIGTDYIDPGAEVSDLYSGDLPPITAASNINVNDPSDQVMTYTAADFNGNKSTFKRFFQLVDETAPTIKFNGDKDRIIHLDATANDDGDFIDSENNVLNIDTGAEGIDNLDNNIDLSKNKITIRKAVEDRFVEVSAVTTDEVAHFKIDYSFTDKSGNESTGTRNVFIREPYSARQPIFENGSVDSTWSEGIKAYDQALPNWGSCEEGNSCPSLKWVTISDSKYGNVLQVTHVDNDFEAGLYISSDTGIDLRGSEETGLLQLDIKRQSGSDPFIDIWADCGYPCAGGPSRQGPFRTGEWTRIYIPIKDIMEHFRWWPPAIALGAALQGLPDA
jgi:hypothetical protein